MRAMDRLLSALLNAMLLSAPHASCVQRPACVLQHCCCSSSHIGARMPAMPFSPVDSGPLALVLYPVFAAP